MLNPEGRLGDYTRKVLRKAREKGMILVPNSGRSLAALLPVLPEKAGIEIAAVLNGAGIYGLPGRRCLAAKSLKWTQVQRILEAAETVKGSVAVIIHQQYFTEQGRMEFRGIQMEQDAYGEQLHREILEKGFRQAVKNAEYPVDKVVLSFPTAEEKYRVLPVFRKMTELRVSYAHEKNIEINQKDATKGVALRWIRQHYGLRKEEVMAMGDHNNDLSMFKEAGCRVAMENGNPELKAQADYIAESNEKEGAAHFIEGLLNETEL